jgi:hypothetical protein
MVAGNKICAPQEPGLLAWVAYCVPLWDLLMVDRTKVHVLTQCVHTVLCTQLLLPDFSKHTTGTKPGGSACRYVHVHLAPRGGVSPVKAVADAAM